MSSSWGMNLCVWCEYFVFNTFDSSESLREQNETIITNLNELAPQISFDEFARFWGEDGARQTTGQLNVSRLYLSAVS